MEFSHIPVLYNEVLSGLNIKPDGIYADGTLGGAGLLSLLLTAGAVCFKKKEDKLI